MVNYGLIQYLFDKVMIEVNLSFNKHHNRHVYEFYRKRYEFSRGIIK